MRLYYGKPCKRCGKTKRYKSNRKCIACARNEKKDPELHVIHQTKYRERWFIKRATPGWADLEAIKRIENEAKRLEEQMGVPMEVVHEIPIRGRRVCGLHVAYNLKVVSRSWRNLRRKWLNSTR